jgi:hypothetical protein
MANSSNQQDVTALMALLAEAPKAKSGGGRQISDKVKAILHAIVDQSAVGTLFCLSDISHKFQVLAIDPTTKSPYLPNLSADPAFYTRDDKGNVVKDGEGKPIIKSQWKYAYIQPLARHFQTMKSEGVPLVDVMEKQGKKATGYNWEKVAK